MLPNGFHLCLTIGLNTLRLVLPILALLAAMFAPLAQAIHENHESLYDGQETAIVAASHADVTSTQTVPHAPHGHPVKHHDASHCAICASIGSLRHLVTQSAFLFSLTCEPAPTFDVPTYLAPTMQAPSLSFAHPRGPPAIA